MKDFRTERIVIEILFVIGLMTGYAQSNQWSSALPLNSAIVQQALAVAPVDINTCGTDPGQTPFTIDAQILSNYNGFGVSCKDTCDGMVEVTVTGGVGPFTFQWVGGPNTAAWNNACGGTEIVIVTDVGQGLQCATSVLVIEPSDVSLIFLPPGIEAPTCPGVCDGSANLFAVGGAGFYSYDWNSGLSMSNNPNDLCPGPNQLIIMDQNGCMLDTTFNLIVDAFVPNEMSQDVQCNGNCDGTIWLNVSGGTPGYNYVWTPNPPFGQGTDSIAQLCAGNYDVTITDASGCDTTLSFIINEPLPILPNPSFTDALCWNTCDGTASVNPASAVGPFNYDWTPDPLNGDGTNTATGLCPGLVTVLITDQASGCDTLVEITIGAPPVLDPGLVTQDATCNGLCDGEGGVTPLGGTGPYTFLWNPVPPFGQGTPNVTGLCAGSYTLLITDALGCDTLVSFDILEPTPIVPAPTSTDLACTGICDGTAEVNPTGGTPNYTYLWTPNPPNGQGTNSVTGLCAGMWTVLVTDDNGCDTLVEFDILEPDTMIGTIAVTDASCSGSCDGEALISMMGGTPNYTYVWTPAPPFGQGTDQVSGLCAGNYSVEVTDDAGCVIDVLFTIGEPSDFNIVLNVVDPSCGSACDGAADLQVSGSNGMNNGDYTYLWTPAPTSGQGTASVTGICLGSYTVLITDVEGCDTTLSFSISNPPLLIPDETVNDVTCFGQCDGSITLNPQGGVGALTIIWLPEPPNGQGVLNATGLCAGVWQATISDPTGCDTVLTVTINEPAPITIGATQNDAICPGICDGSALVEATGNSPFTFSWSPLPTGGVVDTDTTTSASGLCSGLYDITITDSNGCDSIFQLTILDADSIIPVAAITDATCNGQCDGAIDLTVTGGLGPLQFSWSPAPNVGAGTANISGLCPDTYTVTITDANNCSVTESYVVTEPGLFNVQFAITDPSCGSNCDGEALATVTGGNGGYTFFWDPAPFSGQGSNNAIGICLGSYDLTITDSLGCDTTVSVALTTPPLILPNETVQDASCFGTCDGSITLAPSGGVGALSVTWNPVPPSGVNNPIATGLCAGIWEATISDPTGCDTVLVVTINEPAAISVTSTSQDASCSGECDGEINVVATGVVPFTFAWTPTPPIGAGTGNISGLCPGVWALLLTDGNGCDTTIVFQINDPAPIAAALTTTSSACGGGCIGTAAVVASGGTGPLTYLWSPGAIIGQGTPSVTDLCSGAYTLVITDSLGCDTTIQFAINSPSGIVAVPAVSDATCSAVCDGSISLTVTGGLAPYNYLWTPMPPVGDGTPNVSGLCPGIYTVVISDNAACDTTLFITVGSATQILPNETVTQIECNGECTGDILFAPTGGTPGYNYLWNPAPPNGQGVSNGIGLCAGQYDITISDANGCDTTLSITISEPPAFDITLNTTLSTCNVCSGTASVDVLGATPGYQFTWFDDLNQQIAINVDSVSQLCAGSYSVNIQDALGCDSTIAFIISDANGEVLTSSSTPSSCSGTCDGTATVSFVCSDPPCNIDWNDASNTAIGQTTPTATMLCPGTYYAFVTNGSGCLGTDTVIVLPATAINATLLISDVNCKDQCDGSASVTVTGGTAPYQYLWTPAPTVGQGSSIAQGLCAGNYSLLITDGQGCDTTLVFDILEPDSLENLVTVTDETCAGDCDGQVVINTTGGVGPYTYVWSPLPPAGTSGNFATGLCPGIYTVVVFDANNCSETISFTVAPASPISLTATTIASQCGICLGSGEVFANGGSGSYTYSWLDQGGVQISNAATANFLCPGIYNVVVSDASNCDTSIVVTISDGNGEVLTTNAVAPTCPNACDGLAIVDFVCSDPPCLIDWANASGVSLGIANDTLVNCAGTYQVSVTNASNCVTIETVIIAPATGLIPTITATPISCNGVCDGAADVSHSGSVGPFTYVWSPTPITGQGTPSVTGLCPGMYQVLISDGNGCDTIVSVTVNDAPLLAVSAAVTQNNCAGEASASIVLTPSGGSPPYFYAWSPIPPNGQGNFDALGLVAGAYSVTVFDANNCDTTLLFTISDPAPLSLAIATTQSSCGICDGTATATASGGSGILNYAWLDQSGTSVSNSATALNLCAGIYTLQLTDSLGCDTIATVAITDGNGEQLSTSFNAPTCADSCNGDATVSFVCSDPPCLVEWFDGLGNTLGQTGNTATGLCASLYYVAVSNASNCLSVDTVTITPPPFGTMQFNSTPVSCFGTCDGTATITVTSATQPLAFNWSPAPGGGQGTNQGTGLCVGNYSVTITDGNGCDSIVSILILGPNQLTGNGIVGDLSCNGVCDGSILVTPSGGTAPYNYTWSPVPPNGQGNNDATQLCAGMYTVIVGDANGCDTTLSFNVTEPSALSYTLTATQNVPCFGDCSGTASATISGGTAPYNIVWTDSLGAVVANDTLNVSQLCGGSYTYSVTDDAGCTIDTTFFISQGAPLDANLFFINEGCNTPCDAYATINPSGGDGGPYTVTWSAGPTFTSQDSAYGFCAGNYSVTIADASNCDTTIQFTINTAIPISATAQVVAVSCNGAGDGSISLNVSGGTGVYNFAWLPVGVTGQGTDSISGLVPGVYDVLISDSLGCDTSLTFTITEPDSLVISLNQVISPSCASVNDGTIAVGVMGGSVPYVYQWSGPNGYISFSDSITQLFPGQYDLLVLDDANCTTTFSINLAPVFVIDAILGPDTALCLSNNQLVLDGSASIGALTYAWTAIGGAVLGATDSLVVNANTVGTSNYVLTVSDGALCFESDTINVSVLPLPLVDAGPSQLIYDPDDPVVLGGNPTTASSNSLLWIPDSLLDNNAIQNPVFTPGETTWFTVFVTDTNGCVSTDSLLIEILPEVTVPSGFSPNGDGINDIWELDIVNQFPQLQVMLFNRWGEPLFESDGYTTPWDGTYEGQPLPVGTYYYAIELNDPLVPEPLTGPVTIIR